MALLKVFGSNVLTRSVAQKLLTSNVVPAIAVAASRLFHTTNNRSRGPPLDSAALYFKTKFVDPNNNNKAAAAAAADSSTKHQGGIHPYAKSSSYGFSNLLNQFYVEAKRVRRIMKLPETTRLIEPVYTIEKPGSSDIYIYLNQVCDENVKVSVEGNTVLVDAEGNDNLLDFYGFKAYKCFIDLPDNVYKISDFKTTIEARKLGQVVITLPKLNNNNVTPSDDNDVGA